LSPLLTDFNGHCTPSAAVCLHGVVVLTDAYIAQQIIERYCGVFASSPVSKDFIIVHVTGMDYSSPTRSGQALYSRMS
jgi:hypothetical protein